jgi:hypothetical protein
MTTTTAMPLPTDFDVLRSLMTSTANLCQDFMQRFFKEHKRGERDLAGRLYDEYSRNAVVLGDIIRDILVDPRTQVGDVIETVNGPLVVAEIVRDGMGSVQILTEDGGDYTGKWHEGIITGSLRVERYVNGREVFHGYIDPVSRGLTQTG